MQLRALRFESHKLQVLPGTKYALPVLWVRLAAADVDVAAATRDDDANDLLLL